MEIFDSISFLDDGLQTEVNNYPIIGTSDELASYYEEYESIVIAIGNNDIRYKLFHKAKELGYHFPSLKGVKYRNLLHIL